MMKTEMVGKWRRAGTIAARANDATMIVCLITIGIHPLGNKGEQPKPQVHRGRAPSCLNAYAKFGKDTKRSVMNTARSNIIAISTTINTLDITILPDCGIAMMMNTQKRKAKRLNQAGRPSPSDTLTTPPQGNPPPGKNSCVSYAARRAKLYVNDGARAGTHRMGIANAMNIIMNSSVINVTPS